MAKRSVYFEIKKIFLSKQYTKVIALRILFSLSATLVLSKLNLEFIEGWLFDLRVSTKISLPFEQNVTLIKITPQTIQEFNGFPSAKEQLQILNILKNTGAKAIVFDFAFNDITGVLSDKKLLEQEILNSQNVYIASKEVVLRGEEKTLFLAPPFERIKATAAPKTVDQLNFAKDGVTRRMILSYQENPLLQVQLAGLFNPHIIEGKGVRGQFDFYDTAQAYIDFHKENTFNSLSFEKVLNGTIAPMIFSNKIVIIGTDLNLSENEYIKTPFSRVPTAMTRIEMQANMIQTLINNSSPLRLPEWIEWILLGLISFLTIHIVLTMKPTAGIVALVIVLGGFAGLSFAMYWFFGIWVPMAHPLLAGFLCYYFFIPYRLIKENRKSWEYLQKNKLLSQVEELKTNFISMMSHDLKTPIARIQGMTDVILTDQQPISRHQREALDTIKQSSEELLRFVNSILNYGRIESQGFQLHLQSKDINTLIEDVVRKHEFLAKVKRIQLVSKLEPMFPIPVDPDLIKQVFSNLIENAIKYSPEDTQILISSEEFEEKVLIQVTDQGQGIAVEEIPHIFMKFFRCRNAKSSPIKGSGLGLYLAKYFTELHKGQIFVESIVGNGSTFKVELPMVQRGTHA